MARLTDYELSNWRRSVAMEPVSDERSRLLDALEELEVLRRTVRELGMSLVGVARLARELDEASRRAFSGRETSRETSRSENGGGR